MSTPERVEPLFSVYQKYRDQLENLILTERDLGKRYLQLMMITNIIMMQFEAVDYQIDEVIQSADDLDMCTPGELIERNIDVDELRVFSDWCGPWLKVMSSDFDRYKEQRDALSSELSNDVRDEKENLLPREMSYIQKTARSALEAGLTEFKEGRS